MLNLFCIIEMGGLLSGIVCAIIMILPFSEIKPLAFFGIIFGISINKLSLFLHQCWLHNKKQLNKNP